MCTLLPLLWLLGCSGADKPGDSGGEHTGGGDTSGDETGDSGDSGGGDSGDSGQDSDPERPWILSADAYCYHHEVGEEFWNWSASCTADDPQGRDSLSRAGQLGVTEGGTEIARYTLSCNPDDGVCSTTFREDADGVLCSRASSYTLSFVVEDEDGNLSEPVEVTGRPK